VSESTTNLRVGRVECWCSVAAEATIFNAFSSSLLVSMSGKSIAAPQPANVLQRADRSDHLPCFVEHPDDSLLGVKALEKATSPAFTRWWLLDSDAWRSLPRGNGSGVAPLEI